MYLDREFSKLVQLIKSRNNEGVKRLIMTDDRLQTVDFLNQVEKNKYTLLHYAAEAGQLEIVEYLVLLVDNREVSIMSKSSDAQDAYGCTPLHIAAKYGYLDIAKYLLGCTLYKNGRITDIPAVNINGTDYTNKTPLHYAALKGQLNFIKLLVQKGANIYATSSGDKALHIAAESDHADVVEFFLDLGLSIDDPGYNLDTPLHCASRKDCDDVFKFLIKKGADIYAENADGKTAIDIAVVEKGNLDYLMYVINQKRIDINDPIQKEKFTALHCAATKGHLEIAKWCVKQGANIHSRVHTDGENALHLAAENGHIEVVKFLIDMGANIFDELSCGSKPLHLAALAGHKNIVEFFLDQGLSINALGCNGNTPLHLAARGGHLDLAKFLLDRGADANIRNNSGNCKPYNLAREYGYSSVEALLDNRTQPDWDCVIQ